MSISNAAVNEIENTKDVTSLCSANIWALIW